MNKPSDTQLKILKAMAGPPLRPLFRDDTDIPARYYFNNSKVHYETARVLYCRGWIESQSRVGLNTIFVISDTGREAIKNSKQPLWGGRADRTRLANKEL